MYRNEFVIVLVVLLSAIVAISIVGQQPAAPDVSFPSQYAEVVFVGPGFDSSSIPQGSTIVVLPEGTS